MSGLQFSSVEDAFAPLSNNGGRPPRRRPERSEPRAAREETTDEPLVPTVPTGTPATAKTLADEIIAVQPYVTSLFMILVLGMLYDIRQVALELRPAILLSLRDSNRLVAGTAVVG
tara:strand:+ start:508 stop:855 length:348 start_codon:yes stop_codon:yes gene_type:complete